MLPRNGKGEANGHALEVPVRERERERQGLVLSPELRRGIAHGGGGEGRRRSSIKRIRENLFPFCRWMLLLLVAHIVICSAESRAEPGFGSANIADQLVYWCGEPAMRAWLRVAGPQKYWVQPCEILDRNTFFFQQAVLNRKGRKNIWSILINGGFANSRRCAICLSRMHTADQLRIHLGPTHACPYTRMHA